MPEDNEQEIKLQEGESKVIEINIPDDKIPLAVDPKNRPSVKPKPKVNDNLNENDDSQGQDNQTEEAEESGGQGSKQRGEEGKDQDNQADNKEQGGEQGNKEKPSLSEMGQLRKDQQDARKDKQDKDHNDQKPRKKKSSFKDKINKGIEKVGDKITPGIGRMGDKFLSKAPISEKDKRSRKDKKRDRSRVTDDDYPRETSNKSDFASNWNRLRKSIRNKSDKSDINQKRSATGAVINKGSRLASFEFYRLCWLNLIDSFGLTYFGLLFLFIAKYVAHSNKIVKFVTIKDESVRLEIIENKETTSYLMMIGFLLITLLVMLLMGIVIMFIILFLKAQELTLWGLITDTEQFFKDWKIIWKFMSVS